MILPRVVGDMNGEDEYARFRRRQHIHRMHLVGYAASGALIRNLAIVAAFVFIGLPGFPREMQQEEAPAGQSRVVENVAFFPGQSGYP